MNRVEFMEELESLLADIPENDKLDAITYYNDYFDEAGGENEARVIRELGSPERVAAMIKEDLDEAKVKEDEKQEPLHQMNEVISEAKQKKNIPWPMIVVLIIFASPILLGILGGVLGGIIGVFGALLGLFAAVLACALAFVICGSALMVLGIIKLVLSPAEGVLILGIGSLLLAIGILFSVLMAWIGFKWIPALFRVCIRGFQKIFSKRKGGEQV